MLFSLKAIGLSSSTLKLAAMNDKSTLGERMQLALDEMPEIQSPAQLARDVSTSETTIGNWLKDRVRPEEAKAALAIRIARRLRIRVEWLILNEKPMRADGVKPVSQVREPQIEERILERLNGLAVAQAAMTKAIAATLPNAARAFVDELKKQPEAATPELILLGGIARHELANHEVLNSTGPSTRGSGSRKSARS